VERQRPLDRGARRGTGRVPPADRVLARRGTRRAAARALPDRTRGPAGDLRRVRDQELDRCRHALDAGLGPQLRQRHPRPQPRPRNNPRRRPRQRLPRPARLGALGPDPRRRTRRGAARGDAGPRRAPRL